MATYYKLIRFDAISNHTLPFAGEEVFSSFNKAAIISEQASLPAGVRTFIQTVEVADASSVMQQVTVKSLKQGATFSRKIDARKTYTRAEYDRELKKFCCDDDDDSSRNMYLNGSTLVFIEGE